MNKKSKSKLVLSMISGMLMLTMVTAHAVSPGGSFSTSVACGNIQGSVSVSGANATVTSAGNWCEQGQSIAISGVAGSAGTATVTVYTVDASNVTDPANIVLLNPGTYVGASSISVVAPSNGGGSSSNNSGGSANRPQVPDPEDDTHSKDNDLKSLTLSKGTLTPAFSKDVVEYTVNVPASTKSITVNGEANDAKATVTGNGEKALEPGDNPIEIVVTAENLAAKAYKINVIVDEKPLMFTKFHGKNLGVVRNIKNAPVPANFVETTVKLDGKKIPAWENKAMKKTIVYLMDNKDKKQFYLFENGKVTSTFTYVKVLGKEAFLIDIDKKDQDKIGMKYQQLKIDNQAVMGWKFEASSMKNYEIFYVMDLDGECRYYQHELSQNTLQLYSGAVAVTQSDYEKQVADLKNGKLMFLIWACCASVLLVAGCGYAFYLFSKKKK